MLERLGRAWSAWRAKSNLIAPLWSARSAFFATELQFPELQGVQKAGGPELQPYEGLAAGWDEYVSNHLAAYPEFLRFLAKRQKRELRSVLDLACGTGLLTSRLVPGISEVVGLDASPHMLNVAQSRLAGCKGVRFVHGDFRDFTLDRQFDSIVCASNSLNYLNCHEELASVFHSVAKHLVPSGTFVFDVSTKYGMRVLSGKYLHVATSKYRFALHFVYGRNQSKEASQAITPTGIEIHRRIPIGVAEVKAAVRGTGLRVEDCFSTSWLPLSWSEGQLAFFVLVKASD